MLPLNTDGAVPDNQPPIAGEDLILTRSTGQPVTLTNLLQNDSDPDGDSFTIAGVLAGAGGKVSLDPATADVVVFAPSRSFDGNGTFTYQVRDAQGASTTGSVTVRNPFLYGKGVYAGPLKGNPAIPNSAGYLQLSLSPSGVATGKLRYGQERFSFKGLFEMDGTLVSELRLPDGGVRRISLKLATERADQPITGTLTGGNETVFISVPRMLYRRSSPPPFSGAFTVILPDAEPNSATPKGIGYGVLNVSTAGNASFVGRLGDGNRFSSRVFVQPDGSVPVFATLYKDRGSVAGTLSFTNADDTAVVGGDISWIKPKIRRDASYPEGFNITLSPEGARYTVPAAGAMPLQFPAAADGVANASFFFQGGGFGAGVRATVSVPPRPAKGPYTVTATSLRKLELQAKIDARTGVFVGSVLKPNRVGRRKFSGVIVQSLNMGAGVIDAGSGTGVVMIEPGEGGTVVDPAASF